MRLYDIDGDGELELITGARYRAHNGNDPGENNPIGTYIYKMNGGKFEKHTLEYGTPEEGASGVGIYFALHNTDIVTPGKLGLHIFRRIS